MAEAAPASQFVPVTRVPNMASYARFIPIRNGRLDHARAVPMIEIVARPS